MTQPETPGPLQNVRVLDLTTFLSGPYATQILADLGARVIKVEPPGGDATRGMAPHFVGDDSAYFLSINRSKDSVVLDLKDPLGLRTFQRLVRDADVVVENFRPGVLARLGLDYPTLRDINPRIVLCSITGFGQNGPLASRPAYDIIVQALSGGMSMTGEKEGRPVRAGLPIGDLAAGMFGVIGLLSALQQRVVTGEGSHVDVAMLDSQVSMLTYQAAYYLVSGEIPGPQGRGHVSIPTYRSFSCSDGRDLVITANTEQMWCGLCQALQRPDLAADPRYRTNELRLRNKTELYAELEPIFASKPADDWLTRLIDSGVPAARINTVAEALQEEQVQHRDMVVEVDADDRDALRLLGNPVKLSTGDVEFRYPPRLGEHTRAVLLDAGLSQDEVDRLMSKDTVHSPEDAPASGTE